MQNNNQGHFYTSRRPHLHRAPTPIGGEGGGEDYRSNPSLGMLSVPNKIHWMNGPTTETVIHHCIKIFSSSKQEISVNVMLKLAQHISTVTVRTVRSPYHLEACQPMYSSFLNQFKLKKGKYMYLGTFCNISNLMALFISKYIMQMKHVT